MSLRLRQTALLLGCCGLVLSAHGCDDEPGKPADASTSTGGSGGSAGRGGSGGSGGSAGSGGSSGSGGSRPIDAGTRDGAVADRPASTPDGRRPDAGSSDAPRDTSVDTGNAAGPVSGPVDNHCMGMPAQVVDEDVCEAGPGPGGPPEEEEPVPMFNAEGDDDDCKYHLSFTTTPAVIARDTNVSFTLRITKKADGTPAEGGDIEVAATTADMTHPSPNVMPEPESVENPPGTFRYGPVRFDRSGRWLVTFHIQEECTDNDEASPHGHATFFINVP